MPHGWLLPQCSAGVVHGGAGTVAAVVGAGIPCIVTPVMKNDQHWWGAQLNKLGVGVGLNKQLAKTSGADVAAALQTVDGSMREKVKATAAAMQAEDGTAKGVALIASMANRAAKAARLNRRPTSLLRRSSSLGLELLSNSPVLKDVTGKFAANSCAVHDAR